MLKPNVDMSEFEKFGFKKCAGLSGNFGCYYLCVAKGCKFLFVSKICFDVQPWEEDDIRIHKHPNCRYSDKRDYMDIIYDLIKANMLVKEQE